MALGVSGSAIDTSNKGVTPLVRNPLINPSVCRNLFGRPSEGDRGAQLRRELRHSERQDAERWGFDFERWVPLSPRCEGVRGEQGVLRFVWEKVDARKVPKFYHSCVITSGRTSGAAVQPSPHGCDNGGDAVRPLGGDDDDDNNGGKSSVPRPRVATPGSHGNNTGAKGRSSFHQRCRDGAPRVHLTAYFAKRRHAGAESAESGGEAEEEEEATPRKRASLAHNS